MDPAYRILKLKSGEEIITKLVESEKGNLSMEFPMAFRTMLMTDPYTGSQREVTILRDWISYTADKFIKIPRDLVISYSTPLKEAISLYEKEKEKKQSDTKPKSIKNLDSVKKDMENEFQKYLDSMIDQAKKMSDEDGDERSLAEILGMGMNGEEVEWEFEFQFPPEEISDETTEEQTNHPDYGNRWTDWSSDPREY
jgi:hypothetical protein